MAAGFIHFRSNYSLLRGCRSPEEICRFARERRLSTVGMTDINNFYGLILFILAAGREGVRPVAGVVVEKEGRRLFTAYVMNREGYGRICRVLTEVLTDSENVFDPVAALCDRGWDGLSLLRVLKNLKNHPGKRAFFPDVGLNAGSRCRSPTVPSSVL